MGRECGTYETEIRCIQEFGGKIEGKETPGKPRCRGRVTLKWVFKQLNGRERGLD